MLRDVIGHSRLVGWLARQVAAAAPGHAYLLLGPEGVGKRFLAQQFAQALQCEQPVEGDACGRCSPCRLAVGQHPDLLVVAVPEGSRQIKIEQIRHLQQALGLAPFYGRCKVAIVDQADTMQEPAASALLKTLEEPPPRSILILVAADERQLLPTIVSRCAKLYASPLPTADLLRALAQRGVESARAAQVARCAGGRLGRALQLAAAGAWEARQVLLAELRDAVETGQLEPPCTTGRQEAEALRQTLEEGLEALAAWYGQRQTFGAVDAIYETHALIRQRVNPRTAMAALIARLAPSHA